MHGCVCKPIREASSTQRDFPGPFSEPSPPCTACVFNSPRENPRQFPHLIKWSGQPYPPGHMALIVVKQALAIAVEVLQMKIDTMFVGFVQHKP